MASRYSDLAVNSLFTIISGGAFETRLRTVESATSKVLLDPARYVKVENDTMNASPLVEVFSVATTFPEGGYRTGVADTNCVVRLSYADATSDASAASQGRGYETALIDTVWNDPTLTGTVIDAYVTGTILSEREDDAANKYVVEIGVTIQTKNPKADL